MDGSHTFSSSANASCQQLTVAVAVRSTFLSMLFTVCTVVHLHLLSAEHDPHRVYFVHTCHWALSPPTSFFNQGLFQVTPPPSHPMINLPSAGPPFSLLNMVPHTVYSVCSHCSASPILPGLIRWTWPMQGLIWCALLVQCCCLLLVSSIVLSKIIYFDITGGYYVVSISWCISPFKPSLWCAHWRNISNRFSSDV